MVDSGIPGFYYGFAMSTRDIFAPKKSVIVDMVMVQVLTIIVTLSLVLLTGSGKLSSDTMAYMMGAMMGAILLATGIYTRISQQ
jgi:hypothetical protein|tara:strand:- start:688 stop:939 length:252 start_codon:yes stop_codon:yes gene_type:complete